MARTAVLSKNKILESSFRIVNTQGLEKLTMRSIAKVLGTSTAPIYTQYKNMEELKEDLTSYVDKKLMEYIDQKYTENLFFNIGAGLLSFAYENRIVFQTYYLRKNSLTLLMSKNTSIFIKHMKTDPFLSLLDDSRLISLIDDMRIYTFGLATIICTSDDNKDLQHYFQQLDSTGDRLIKYHLFSSGNLENCFSIIKNNLHKCPKERENK